MGGGGIGELVAMGLLGEVEGKGLPLVGIGLRLRKEGGHESVVACYKMGHVCDEPFCGWEFSG
jgi:hypothetical protein